MHVPGHTIILTALAALLLFGGSPARATISGLNQIATPDIKPAGQLSITYQSQHPSIGNPQQVQAELGLTERFAVAIYRGFEPGETLFNAEYGLLHTEQVDVAAGLSGTQDVTHHQPYIEGGYRTGRAYLIGGVQWHDGGFFGAYGIAYEASRRITIVGDYVSGPDAFAALGFVWEIAEGLYINPAVFVSNRDHEPFGFGSITWEIKLW